MERFLGYISDLLQRPDVRRLARRKDHHFQQNRLEHCLATAKLSYHAARLLNADVRVCTRAALLHDWYFEARNEHTNRVGANVHHYKIAAANARGIGEPASVVEIIERHMWPYGRRAPHTREGWIVWMADNVIWMTDAVKSGLKYIRRKLRLFLYGHSREVRHAI